MVQDPDNLDWVRLTRYLTGELSPAEAEAVERWFEADPRHRELLDELRAVWTATAGETAGWGTDAAVAELRRRALGSMERRSYSVRSGAVVPAAQRAAPRFTLARSRSWVPLAAGIAAVLIGAVGVTLHQSRSDAPPAVAAAPLTDVVTQRAQQAEVRLADGSRVILGPTSRLSYATDFGARERTVVLEGEAYFDVVHDATRPFRVRTAQGVAEDIGTAFVVRARGEAPLQVVVTEGAVVLRPPATVVPTPASERRDSLLLMQGQFGRVLADGRLEFRPRVDTALYVAWTRGELVFEDTPLADVAEELSRWYDVDVSVANAALGRRHFSGRFSRRSIDEAVRLIASVADVSVRRGDAGWVFTR